MLRRGKVYDVATYLPYDGSYLSRIIYLGEPAVNAYNYLLKLATKRSQQEGYIATIMYEGKTVNLNVSSSKRLDEKIKKSYGDSAYLINLKKLVSPPLVKFKSMRIAIAVGYAIHAAEKLYPELESENKTYTKEHSEYAAEIAKLGISGDARIDLMGGHEDLKENLYSKGLMIYENDCLTLLPEIISSIHKRRSKYSSAVVRHAERQFAHDVFHFFITEPRRVRSSFPLYPGISVTADPETFDFLNYSGVESSFDLVQEKIKLETFSKVGRALGPAVVYLSGKPVDWCAKEFNLNNDEIKKAADEVSLYNGKVSDQAQEFIEGLNPAKDKDKE